MRIENSPPSRLLRTITLSIPQVAKDLARETLALNISLTPDQVRDLADKIKKAVSDLKNVNEILKESEADLNDAMKLKEEAMAGT